MTHDDGLRHPKVVEHRHEVGGVGRHAERTRQGAAGAATTQVWRNQRDPPLEPVGHPGPGRVRPGDAVHGEHRGSAPPPGHEQLAAGDRHRDMFHIGISHL